MTPMAPLREPPTTGPDAVDPEQGLSKGEVARRRGEGRGKEAVLPISRPLRDILRANVLST